MTDYRIYLFDREGHIRSAPHIARCADDETALAEARQFLDWHILQVWDRARHVGTIIPDGSAN
jgi:hypothetical protein